MITLLGIVLLAEFCNMVGQTLFKKSVDTFELPDTKSFGVFVRFFGQVFASGWIWLGLLAMGTGLLVWFFALSRGDISLVYPIGSLQYVLVLISARLFLKEKISSFKMIGTLFVIFGIILIARS